jgi:hypothetical protein
MLENVILFLLYGDQIKIVFTIGVLIQLQQKYYLRMFIKIVYRI